MREYPFRVAQKKALDEIYFAPVVMDDTISFLVDHPPTNCDVDLSTIAKLPAPAESKPSLQVDPKAPSIFRFGSVPNHALDPTQSVHTLLWSRIPCSKFSFWWASETQPRNQKKIETANELRNRMAGCAKRFSVALSNPSYRNIHRTP